MIRIERAELALDETTGIQVAAIGCLLMVPHFIADELPDRTDVRRIVSRALIAQKSEQRLDGIVPFVADTCAV